MANLNEKDNIYSTLSYDNKVMLIVMIPFAVIFIIILIYFSIMLINKDGRQPYKR